MAVIWRPVGRSATFGELLGLAVDPEVQFVFKGYGHRGEVIATRVEPIPGRPLDVIGPQRDFVRLTETQRSSHVSETDKQK